MFPAKSGDSFLVSFGENMKEHMIIDSGFKDTYDDHLKGRLKELSEEDHLINLLIVTHIDKDHICGALELLKSNGQSQSPKVIEIKEIWHNSYRHLEFKHNNDVSNTEDHNEILQSIILNGQSTINEQSGKVSASQGSMLASYILENGYNWNVAYDGKAIVSNNNYERLSISNNIRLIVLSPSIDSLEKLKKRWRRELERKKFGFQFEEGKLFDDAYEFFMMRQDAISHFGTKKKVAVESFSMDSIKTVDLDTSETNESSIAFIIEYKTHKALFLGDSNPTVIITSLLELKEKENYEMNFDLVKVSHHGSLHNTTVELLNIISSSRWIISGNGEHGNPDIDTIKLILKSNKEIQKQLYFNYSHDWLGSLYDEFLMSEYMFEVIVPKTGESISIVLEG